ncbi:MAG: ATP-dependent helicase, partial [Acidimicrobiales bacterium]
PAGYADEATRHRREPSVGIDVVARAYEGYEAAKRKAAVVDFDDLLWLGIHAIETDGDAAAAARWQHQHLFVDEFQDVNPLQFRLLQAWLGPRSDLCVVGDPNQAIYAWNGADPGLLTDFAVRFPAAEVVALPRNHRSTPQVLTLANRVLDAGGLPGVRLSATRPDGPDPIVTAVESGDDEAVAIAAALRHDHDRNVTWSQQAVLVRTNFQAAALAAELQTTGIPVRLRAKAALVDLPVVKEAMARLQRRGFVEGLATIGDDDDLDVADEDRAGLAELLRLAGEYTAVDPVPTAVGFAGWLAAAASDDPLPGEAAVVVATFHAAKGLEWPVVHIAGFEVGSIPHARATTAEAQAEERRLLYVALTRAERVLYLWWARTRVFGTKTVRRRPSPFLAELHPVLDAMAQGAAPVDGRPEVAAALDVVRAAGARRAAPPRSALADDLDAWRRRRIRGSPYPAAQALDDDAIMALCQARPVDEQGVAAIIGPVRAQRLAPELLALIAAHPPEP